MEAAGPDDLQSPAIAAMRNRDEVVRLGGIEPPRRVWKTRILPLNDSRIKWWTSRELHPQHSPCKGGALLTMLEAHGHACR